ncbi:MAG TPA: hypothetical protein VIQ29_25015 [Ancylobacter sp.]
MLEDNAQADFALAGCDRRSRSVRKPVIAQLFIASVKPTRDFADQHVLGYSALDGAELVAADGLLPIAQ